MSAEFSGGIFEIFTGKDWARLDSAARAFVRRKDFRSYELVVRCDDGKEYPLQLGAGDPVVVDESDRTALWPQARFTFATPEEFGAFADCFKLAADFFRMQMTRETLLCQHGFDASVLPPLVACEPKAPGSKPTAAPEHSLRSDAAPRSRRAPATPVAPGTKPEAGTPVSRRLSVSEGAVFRRAFFGTVPPSVAPLLPPEDTAPTRPPPAGTPTLDAQAAALATMIPLTEAAADPCAPTDAHVRPLLGGYGTCHSCGYRRALVIRCPHSLGSGPQAASAAAHSWCGACLQRSLRIDFHCLRTGLLQWRCPVCTGACPCTPCVEVNGGARPYRYNYAQCVDRGLLSVEAGGTARRSLSEPLLFPGSAEQYPGGSVYDPQPWEIEGASGLIAACYDARLRASGLARPPHLEGRTALQLSTLAATAPEPEPEEARPAKATPAPRRRSTDPSSGQRSSKWEDAWVFSPRPAADAAARPRQAGGKGKRGQRYAAAAATTAIASAVGSDRASSRLARPAGQGLEAWAEALSTPLCDADHDAVMAQCTGTLAPLTRGLDPPDGVAELYTGPPVLEPGGGCAVSALTVTPTEGLVGIAGSGPSAINAERLAVELLRSACRPGHPKPDAAPATTSSSSSSSGTQVYPPKSAATKARRALLAFQAALLDRPRVWGIRPGKAKGSSALATILAPAPAVKGVVSRPLAAPGLLRCCLCDQTESQARSRRRSVTVHPLMPLRTTGRPVLICDQCEKRVLDTREWAAANALLHGDDGMEELCSLCAAGTPRLPTKLTLCSARLCVRGLCEACMDLVVDTPAGHRTVRVHQEWLCPPCASVSAMEIHCLELLQHHTRARRADGATLSKRGGRAAAVHSKRAVMTVADPSPRRRSTQRRKAAVESDDLRRLFTAATAEPKPARRAGKAKAERRDQSPPAATAAPPAPAAADSAAADSAAAAAADAPAPAPGPAGTEYPTLPDFLVNAVTEMVRQQEEAVRRSAWELHAVRARAAEAGADDAACDAAVAQAVSPLAHEMLGLVQATPSIVAILNSVAQRSESYARALTLDTLNRSGTALLHRRQAACLASLAAGPPRRRPPLPVGPPLPPQLPTGLPAFCSPVTASAASSTLS